MRFWRIAALLMAEIIMTSCCTTYASDMEEKVILYDCEETDQYAPFTDTSLMSDEEFFGVWDEENQVWKTEGKINYAYSSDLAETERYVKLGGYTMAKKALLEYYKNREEIQKPELYSGNNASFRFLTMHDMYNMTEPYINTFTVSSGEYERYEIDLGTSTASGVFMLAALEKDGDVLSIASKEGNPALAPKLILYYTTGTVVELDAIMDSYTRAYDNEVDYRNECYGAKEDIEVKDGWYQSESGRYIPYSSNTREGYIAFDSSAISKTNLLTAKLVLYAKLKPEEETEQRTQESKEIIVFDAYNKSWRETDSDEGTYPVLTWGSISHNHYSWNGLPGGFDWQKPELAASEYINYNMRMTQLPALIRPYMETGEESYMYKAIEIALDFIGDAGAATPPNRELEPAQRILEMTPAFFYFSESSLMNGEAAAAMLKYFWEEGEYLYAAPVYYDYNNRGLWHTTAFYTLISYFPEFKDVEKWQPVAEDRLEEIVYTLIHDDGCYNEATFGYPNSIITFLRKLVAVCNDTGKETPSYVTDRLGKLCHYMMACAYPTGSTADWGEGSRGYATGEAYSIVADLLDDDELLYAATSGADGKAPEETTFKFENLKIVTSRTDWGNEAYMIFINAKNGGYHNHKDSLALTMFAKDREVLCDTGMTSYDGNHPHFDWQRHQTKSHNTIEIDNTGQRGETSTLTGNGDSNIEVYASDSNDRIMAWTDATLGFRHYRNVSFFKKLKFAVVSDMVSPSDDKPHTYTQNWHVPINSDVSIDPVTKIGMSNFTGGSNIKIIQARPDSVDATLQTGYASEGQTVTNYFCYQQNAVGNVAYDTILLPIEEGDDIETVVNQLDTGTASPVSSAMQILLFKNNDERESVIYYNSNEYDEQGVPVPTERTFADYTTDAANMTVIMDADDKITAVSMCFGTKAVQNEKILLESSIKLDNLTVEYENGEAIIESSDQNIEEAVLTFSADVPIQRVERNGVEVPFTSSDGKIIVNGAADPIPSSKPSGGGGLAPGGNAGNTLKNFGDTGANIVSEAVPTASAAPAVSAEPMAPQFNDIQGHWAESEILKMAEEGIVKGNENGDFEPERQITRAEFAALAVRAAGGDTVAYKEAFQDVYVNDWYATEVQTARDYGWIVGDGEFFRPNDAITRAEAVAILCRIYVPDTDKNLIQQPVFTDSSSFENWAIPYIVQAAGLGLVNGYADGSFKPNAETTRAEAVVMLGRAENIAKEGLTYENK